MALALNGKNVMFSAFIQIPTMEAKGSTTNKFKTCNHIIIGSHLSSFQKQNGKEMVKLWRFVEKWQGRGICHVAQANSKEQTCCHPMSALLRACPGHCQTLSGQLCQPWGEVRTISVIAAPADCNAMCYKPFGAEAVWFLRSPEQEGPGLWLWFSLFTEVQKTPSDGLSNMRQQRMVSFSSQVVLKYMSR